MTAFLMPKVRLRCGEHLVPVIYVMITESSTGKVEVSRARGECEVCRVTGWVYQIERPE